MIKAVIFDMDGVLIDSEIVYLDYLYYTLKKDHPWIEREDFYPTVGSTSRRTREIIAQVLREDPDSPAFSRKYARLWEGCRVNYPSIMREAVPGLLENLKRLGYMVALASSSTREGIGEVLSTCGIERYFDYVVSGEMFRESKPDPEIYLHTAETLGCDPAECLVVEDSTYGITAGHRAGMTVTALIDDRFGFDRALADYSITGLIEVLEVLERLGDGHD